VSELARDRVNPHYHSRPFAILEILISSSADALRLVQTKQAVIKLPYDIFRTQKIVEKPLLPESPYVCTKN
jgi:hypothetical protein